MSSCFNIGIGLPTTMGNEINALVSMGPQAQGCALGLQADCFPAFAKGSGIETNDQMGFALSATSPEPCTQALGFGQCSLFSQPAFTEPLPTVLTTAEMAVTNQQQYSWDLSDIYQNIEAWKQDKESFLQRLPELSQFQGCLGESSNTLLNALELMFDLKNQYLRLYIYAMLLSDLDTRVEANQALMQEAETLEKLFDETSAYIVPEILGLDSGVLNDFITENDHLKIYEVYLKNIFRLTAHTRNTEVEKLLAQLGQPLGVVDKTFNIFSDAEMPTPTVTLSTGETIRLDASGYVRYRSLANKNDRHLVFRAFWENYTKFRATFGSLLYGGIMRHVFYKEAKAYDSCLEAALDKVNIPTAVYTQLISDVHDNLDVFQRYLTLRKRILGLSKLTYEDMYVPLVGGMESEFTVDQAQQMVLQATQPLGDQAQSMLQRAFTNGWVDYYPAKGKCSGAYSVGMYGVHPYQLLNFTGDYTSVSMLAHEMGHGLHSYLTNTNQPAVYANYSSFVAEVASTVNESLLFRHMLGKTKTNEERLSLLGQRLESYRILLFRQALFAEYELKIHEMCEEGKPITGEVLSTLYLSLLRKYYGHEQGVTNIDELYGIEWAFISHLYNNFYVYTYATSLTASTDIARRIAEDESSPNPTHKPREAYLKMISSGSSLDPIGLLKMAGVDMTTSQPFNAAMAEMNELMDKIERILDSKPSLTNN